MHFGSVKFLRKLALAAILFISAGYIFAASPSGASSGEMYDFLEYSEFSTLYDETNISSQLHGKLNRFFSVPFVQNSNDPRPGSFSSSPIIGEFLRVAQWNIERGLEFDALLAAFQSDEKLAQVIDAGGFLIGEAKRIEIFEQARLLRNADVIILNEVDWGVKRSGYRNIAGEIAASLGMNYAFGVEFVELSPVHLMRVAAAGGTDNAEISEIARIDAARYRGLHGSAILSRFPLENVRLIPFKHRPYDWFQEEKKGVSFVEKAKRKLVKTVFLAEALKEVRRGGRTMLIADIAHSRLPSGRATIVATHLENRTSPKNRQIQLAELLDTIKDIRNPVVVAGDMNTSTNDMTPTSVERELKLRFGKAEAWAKRGINYLLGFGMIEDALAASLTFGRNHGDPTVRHIPFFMPNDERKFFSVLKNFRFGDGGAFDFRGEALRSANGKRNTLANSNERDEKGFVTTFRLQRPVKFIGRFKLDWIFVKPAKLFDPSDYQGSYQFAPHFGRTLGAVNSIAENRISDHSPLIVDLPLTEPQINVGADGVP